MGQFFQQHFQNVLADPIKNHQYLPQSECSMAFMNIDCHLVSYGVVVRTQMQEAGLTQIILNQEVNQDTNSDNKLTKNTGLGQV